MPCGGGGGVLLSLSAQQLSFKAHRPAPDRVEPANSTSPVGSRDGTAQDESEGGGLKLRNALLDLYAAIRTSGGAGGGAAGGGCPGGGSPEASFGEGGAFGAEEEAWPSFPDGEGAGGGWDWGGGLWGGGSEGLGEDLALLLDPAWADPDRSARAQWELPI